MRLLSRWSSNQDADPKRMSRPMNAEKNCGWPQRKASRARTGNSGGWGTGSLIDPDGSRFAGQLCLSVLALTFRITRRTETLAGTPAKGQAQTGIKIGMACEACKLSIYFKSLTADRDRAPGGAPVLLAARSRRARGRPPALHRGAFSGGRGRAFYPASRRISANLSRGVVVPPRGSPSPPGRRACEARHADARTLLRLRTPPETPSRAGLGLYTLGK